VRLANFPGGRKLCPRPCPSSTHINIACITLDLANPLPPPPVPLSPWSAAAASPSHPQARLAALPWSSSLAPHLGHRRPPPLLHRFAPPTPASSSSSWLTPLTRFEQFDRRVRCTSADVAWRPRCGMHGGARHLCSSPQTPASRHGRGRAAGTRRWRWCGTWRGSNSQAAGREQGST
jgi:hypothetical protein